VLSLIGKSEDIELRRALTMADRMSPMLAYSARVQGNPRIVKRLLNVVRMRTAIARKRKMPLDETVIAKLALFERCTETAAVEFLHDQINAAPNGRPDLLARLEAAETPTEVGELMPEPWQKYADVVKDWFGCLSGPRDRPVATDCCGSACQSAHRRGDVASNGNCELARRCRSDRDA
jgi:hypothetical protein